MSIWLPGPDGRRPVYGGVDLLQNDPAWKDNLLFYEYFHGDNGAGLGACTRPGGPPWSRGRCSSSPRSLRERFLEGGKQVVLESVLLVQVAEPAGSR